MLSPGGCLGLGAAAPPKRGSWRSRLSRVGRASFSYRESSCSDCHGPLEGVPVVLRLRRLAALTSRVRKDLRSVQKFKRVV